MSLHTYWLHFIHSVEKVGEGDADRQDMGNIVGLIAAALLRQLRSINHIGRFQLVRIKEGCHLIRKLCQDALSEGHAVSVEISEGHKLDDVSGGDVTVGRTQQLVVTVKKLHGAEVCAANTHDDDGHGQMRGIYDGSACVVHVCDHSICDDEQHIVLCGRVLPESLSGEAGNVSDDWSKVGGTPELYLR